MLGAVESSDSSDDVSRAASSAWRNPSSLRFLDSANRGYVWSDSAKRQTLSAGTVGITDLAAHEVEPLYAVAECGENGTAETRVYRSAKGVGRGHLDTLVSTRSDTMPMIGGSIAYSQDNFDANANVPSLRLQCRLSHSVFASCVRWAGNDILLGTRNGQVLLYKGVATSNATSMSEVAQVYEHPKTNLGTVYIPGQYPLANRVFGIAVDRGLSLTNETQAVTMFATVHNQRLYVWDIESGSMVTSSKPSSSALFALDMSSHDPNLIAVAGMTQTVKVADIRRSQKNVLQGKKIGAHTDAVRCISWSPHIPHVLASGGDDGCVSIWDLRSTSKPVLSLEGHGGSVLGLDWSPSHAEQFASFGADRLVVHWSLGLAPRYIVGRFGNLIASNRVDSSPVSGEITGVAFSRARPFEFGVTSRFNDLRAVGIEESIMHQLSAASSAADEYEDMGKEGGKIMDRVACRDYATAFSSATVITQRFVQAGKVDQAKQVVKLLRPVQPRFIEPDYGVIDLMSDIAVRGLAQVDSRFAVTKPTAEVRSKLDFLSLAVILGEIVESKRVENLEQLDEDLLVDLSRDVDALDASLLEQLLSLSMQEDLFDAHELGIRIGRRFEELGEFHRFARLARVFCDPTIFDTCLPLDQILSLLGPAAQNGPFDKSVASALYVIRESEGQWSRRESSGNRAPSVRSGKHFERSVLEPRAAFRQLALVKRLAEVIRDLRDGDVAANAEEVADIIEPGEVCVSQNGALCLLYCTLTANRFVDHCQLASELLSMAEGFPFVDCVERILRDVTLPRLQLRNRHLLSPYPLGDADVKDTTVLDDLIAPMFELLQVLMEMPTLPADFISDSQALLFRFLDGIQQAYLHLLSNERTREMSHAHLSGWVGKLKRLRSDRSLGHISASDLVAALSGLEALL